MFYSLTSCSRYVLCKRFCQNVMSTRAGQSRIKISTFVHFENKFLYVCKKAHSQWCIKRCHRRYYCTTKRRLVLGIETSCDDTGAAVVDDRGEVLGEALNSQTANTVRLGGVIPTIARDLHKQNIDQVVTECLALSKMRLEDLDAIAVTVKPGLSMSLRVGLNYAKHLAQKSGKPLIPVHHMEAHALTVRLLERIEFPFLVLLLSGGHCLLAVARDVEDFLLLGHCLDDSPGDAFDKTARRLKLKNLPECEGLSGGASIELLASRGNPNEMPFPLVMASHRNCNFSFTGLKSSARKLILIEEERQGVAGGMILPNVADICASFQFAVLSHIARRLERALIYCDQKELLTGNKTLVVSGGVASNQFIRRGLDNMCKANNTRLVCPPLNLCTDNGVMIAWNGMEKLLKGTGIVEDAASVDFQPKCPLGTNIIEDVQREDIKLPRLRNLTNLLLQE